MLRFFRSFAFPLRALVWLGNGILIALCAIWAAHIANAWIGLWLSEIDPLPTPTAVAPPRRTPTWADREAILNKKLFRVAAQEEAVVPPPEPEPAEELEETALPYRLLGTAASPLPDQALAVIEDQRTQAVLVLRVGEKLSEGEGVTLMRVERHRIAVDNQGRHEALSLDDGELATLEQLLAIPPPPPPTSATAPPQSAPLGGTLPPSPGELYGGPGDAPLPPPGAVAPPQSAPLGDASPPSPEELYGGPGDAPLPPPGAVAPPQSAPLGDASPPSPEELYGGPGDGLSVAQLPPGLPLPIADLREGDTIVAVNGIDLRGGDPYSALFEALTRPGPSELVVVGVDGERRTLTLPPLSGIYE